MFEKIIKKFKYFKLINSNLDKKLDKLDFCQEDVLYDDIPASTKHIKNKIKLIFGQSKDVIIREIEIGQENKKKCVVVFIEGLSDKQLINESILEPLMMIKDVSNLNFLKIKEKFVPSCEVSDAENFNDAINGILSGDTIVFFENEKKALNVSLRSFPERAIKEPDNETVVIGPREGFTEVLRTNTSLLRKKLKSTHLRFESYNIGEQSKTEICICYMNNIVNQELVETVRKKIKEIKIDAILESEYIKECISDYPLALFPTIGSSERPDVIASKILEGRIAIICDTSPVVMTVPYLFIDTIQSSEDYYYSATYATINRILRIASVFITTMLPAYYVAIVSFHQNIIPFRMVLTMTASRQGIPFSPIVESLLMIVIFEFIREAGVRMPKAIGQAISIVGALVIGEAAVNAGIVSAPMVIVVALTAITSFISYRIAGALLVIRISTMIAASILGILGVLLVSVAFFIYMCSLKSFGVFYLSPLAPISGMDLKDSVIRVPLWAMVTRPKELTWIYNRKTKYRKPPLKGENK